MDGHDGRLVPAEQLAALAAEILAGVGAPHDSAVAVSRSLVRSNLMGHDSHGVRRLRPYVEAVHEGRIDPAAQPVARPRGSGSVIIEGRRAFGQLSAQCAVEEIRSATEEHGTATAVIRDGNHVGRLGEYVESLANHDLVALAFCNADATVAPFGGRERRLGTNPLAWAVPQAKGAPPIVMDWATSATAEGKLAVALADGQRIPYGQLLDASGEASTDPGSFYEGGALLPFGGHKGYGLGVIIEVLGGLLTGTGISSLPGYDGSFGTVLCAFDITRFVSAEYFREQAGRFCSQLVHTPLATGHDDVLIPGELEERTRQQRTQQGIPVPETIWRDMHELLSRSDAGQQAADSPEEVDSYEETR